MNNNFNQNFLLDENNIDIENEESSVIDNDDSTNAVLNEAVRRIQQAKLYEAMLNHKFFTPGSANADIINTVQKEFKGFIMHRLEVLLGIKTDSQAATMTVSSPFSEDETAALKAMAKRLLDPKVRQQAAPASPTINPIALNTVNVAQQPVMPKTPVNTAAEVKAPKRKRKSESVSVATGQDYSQAVNPSRPPRPMLSQSEMDSLNARQASINSGQGQSDAVSRLLTQVAAVAQHNNRNIKEE